MRRWRAYHRIARYFIFLLRLEVAFWIESTSWMEWLFIFDWLLVQVCYMLSPTCRLVLALEYSSHVHSYNISTYNIRVTMNIQKMVTTSTTSSDSYHNVQCCYLYWHWVYALYVCILTTYTVYIIYLYHIYLYHIHTHINMCMYVPLDGLSTHIWI